MSLILALFFSLSKFLGCLWHVVTQIKSILPWYVLFHLYRGGQRGSKWAFLSILGHFDHLKKSWKAKRCAKCFEFVSQHVRPIPEIHSVKEMQLKLSSNVRFSDFSKFPIHFHWISIVRFEFVGGSPIFFWLLLYFAEWRILSKKWLIFVPFKNLKKPNLEYS